LKELLFWLDKKERRGKEVIKRSTKKPKRREKTPVDIGCTATTATEYSKERRKREIGASGHSALRSGNTDASRDETVIPYLFEHKGHSAAEELRKRQMKRKG